MLNDVTLPSNLSQANVGFVVMGGVRNFAHYAAESIIAILTKRLVQVWIVIDRDERDAEEVKRLTDGLGGSARLIVLQKRELENYLLSTGPLARFITLKQDMQGLRGALQADDASLQLALDEAAEELQTFTVAKRVHHLLCTPIYPPRQATLTNDDIQQEVAAELDSMISHVKAAHARIDEVVASTRTEVQQTWGTRKLDIVPGSLLLDKVCQRFSVRYKKEQDGSRLAGLTPKKDIPSEMADLIAEIGSSD